MAAFVLKPVNVLLLDEASNHLDGTAIEALCDGLRGWEGAVIAITHNPAFAAALNPTIVAKIENGAFAARMHVAGAELGVGDRAARTPTTEDPSPIAVDDEESHKIRRAMEKEAAGAPRTIDKIERSLAVLDAQIAALDADLVAAGADVARAVDLQRQKDEKLKKQALYYDEWERLESVVASVAAFDEDSPP